MHGDDCEKQISVLLNTALGGDGCVFCNDETVFFQQANVFCNGVARDAGSLRWSLHLDDTDLSFD